jgi:hypothetical protein
VPSVDNCGLAKYDEFVVLSCLISTGLFAEHPPPPSSDCCVISACADDDAGVKAVKVGPFDELYDCAFCIFAIFIGLFVFNGFCDSVDS